VLLVSVPEGLGPGVVLLLELGTTDEVYERAEVDVEDSISGTVTELTMVLTVDSVKVPPAPVHNSPCNGGGQSPERFRDSLNGVHVRFCNIRLDCNSRR
jgi:hypothetical protein